MTETLIAVLAVLGTAITGVAAWAVARRATSGSVKTSEAESLWAESQAMRKELRDEAAAGRSELTALRAELAGVRVSLEAVRAEAELCHQQMVATRARLIALEGGAQ